MDELMGVVTGFSVFAIALVVFGVILVFLG